MSVTGLASIHFLMFGKSKINLTWLLRRTFFPKIASPPFIITPSQKLATTISAHVTYKVKKKRLSLMDESTTHCKCFSYSFYILYFYPFYIDIGLLWAKIIYLKSHSKAFGFRLYDTDLANEVSNIDFGQGAAKI